MPYQIRIGESVNAALVRIAREQISRGIDEIDAAGFDRHETVHQLRKRCKKLRGLLRAFRPALGATYQYENACFRDASRTLSDVRDAQSLVMTLDALTSHYSRALAPGFARPVRARLVAWRGEAADAANDLDDRLQAVRHAFEQARRRSADWSLSEPGFAAIAGGLRKTYGRGRKAMAEAIENPSAEAFHDWRKSSKDFWYQQRLLRPVWPAIVKQQCRAASKLSDLLGDEHDLAVLADTLMGASEEFDDVVEMDVLLGLAQRRRLALRQQAQSLGERVFAEKPNALVQRFERYWSVWQRGLRGQTRSTL